MTHTLALSLTILSVGGLSGYSLALRSDLAKSSVRRSASAAILPADNEDDDVDDDDDDDEDDNDEEQSEKAES